MKTIVLRNSNNQLNVELMVDLIDDNQAFTIMSIEDRSDDEVESGIDLQKLPNSIEEMETFAKNNNLLMDIIDIDPAVATINKVASVTALNVTTTGAMTGGNVGVDYHQQVETEGGNGPKTFSVTAGSLPAGLNLDPRSGWISGTPTGVENPSFSIKVEDQFGATDTEAGISINIAT